MRETINVTLPLSDGGGDIYFFALFRKRRNHIIPKTKLESIVFSAVTAWIMVYIMTLYNTVLAFQGMWLEFVLIFLCAYFISSRVAKHFAFRVVKPGDRPIFIILAIQIFTVISQVALASILGVWHGYGFTSQFLPNYLVTYCRNFIMALPVQLFLAGPVARWLFRLLFRRVNGAQEKQIKKELRKAGIAE